MSEADMDWEPNNGNGDDITPNPPFAKRCPTCEGTNADNVRAPVVHLDWCPVRLEPTPIMPAEVVSSPAWSTMDRVAADELARVYDEAPDDDIDWAAKAEFDSSTDQAAEAAGTVDPEKLAREELAAKMVPSPSDIMEELGLLAGLYYVNQVAWAGYTLMAAELQSTAEAGGDAPADVTKALQVMAEVVGMLDEACIGLGLLPVAAGVPA